MHNSPPISPDEAILHEIANRSSGYNKPIGKGAQEIASVHEFLNEGKTGLINDGDPTHYLHRGGYKFSAPMDGAGSPIQGPPGSKQLLDTDPARNRDYHRQMDELIERQYHTGRFA